MAPRFQVAVRNADGHPILFQIQHEEITDLDQVMNMAKNEVPDARAILIGIQGGKGNQTNKTNEVVNA